MPEQVRIDTSAGLIEISSRGILTTEEMYASLNSVIPSAREHAINKLLIDVTEVTELPPIGEIYQFISTMAKQAANIKQALVVSTAPTDKIRFIDDVSFSKGVTLKITSSREEALAWLNS